MKNDLIQTILRKKLSCIIVSPHNDDAMLSASVLIEGLSGKIDITVVTVFTGEPEKPYTISARKFLHSSGYSDAALLYQIRKEEDRKAFSYFNVSLRNLDLPDALFRKKKVISGLGKFIPELGHVYPTYQLHIQKGNVHTKDQAVEQLKKKLLPYKNTNTVVVAPMGIGNHVDHILVRDVCKNLFDKVIYYSDFPYNARLHIYGKAKPNYATVSLSPDLSKKEKILKEYKSQFMGLFPTGHIPEHQEVYFVPNNL